MSVFHTGCRNPGAVAIQLFQTRLRELVRFRLYPYSHCGLVLWFNEPYMDFDVGGYAWESIWKKKRDPAYGKVGQNGVRGPIPIHKMYEWARQKRGRRVRMLGVPPPGARLPQILDRLFWAREHIRYAPPNQLLANGLNHLTGRGHNTRLLSPDRWHCSETCARVLCGDPSHLWRRAFGLGDRNSFDSINPRDVEEAAIEAHRILNS
jgi:hypothetical protein